MNNKIKKILFISFFKIEKKENDGVAKKIHSQINTLQKLGFDVNYTFVRNDKVYLNIEKNIIFLFNTTGAAYKDTAILFNILKKMIEDKKIQNLDYVYVRKTSSNLSSIRFLKVTKRKGIKNIIEIPVYPYRGEKIKSLKSFIGYYQDFILNKLFLRKSIELIINYNGYKSIFNTPSISICNGIEMDSLKLTMKKPEEKTINLGTVSSMAYWHGYDRIIEGLKDYYLNKNNKYQIKLHLIGVGPEVEKYKELCEKYKLNDKVFFYGYAGGKELDLLFNKIDIGIIALGIFRKGLENVSSIKTAEFCARGIPFVYGGSEEGLNGKEEFALKVSNDNTPINIEQIIEFFEGVTNDVNLPEKMREFAEDRFTWSTQYRKIFNNIR
jgi:glycosyltransferase involved in cell wall biosynthesis